MTKLLIAAALVALTGVAAHAQSSAPGSSYFGGSSLTRAPQGTWSIREIGRSHGVVIPTSMRGTFICNPLFKNYSSQHFSPAEVLNSPASPFRGFGK
jgi:hypothetical protein